MKVIGIIAEYNPFHNGHAYQIREIKKRTGADYVIAAMSGDFVQRGAPAVIDKYARAKMALSCGIDLVLELPVLWATSSAESFAMAGVTMFEKTGCVDGICFGAETDNLPLLSMAADILADEPDAYRDALLSNIKRGLNFPRARASALLHALPESDADTSMADELQEALDSPNNILAIEYLKALKRRGSAMVPLLLKREGAGYHDTAISVACAPQTSATRTAAMHASVITTDFPAAGSAHSGNAHAAAADATIAPHAQDSPGTGTHFTAADATMDLSTPGTAQEASAPVPAASATAIRNVLAQFSAAAFLSARQHEALPTVLKNVMPAPAFLVLSDYLAQYAPVWEDDFSAVLDYLLLSLPKKTLSGFGGCNADIANRLHQSRRSLRTFSSFCEEMKSRDITYTRMSRVLLHLILGIKNEDYVRFAKRESADYVPYLRMLGFKKDSAPLLRLVSKNASVPLLSKLADAAANLTPEANALLEQDIFAADFYEQTLARKKRTTSRSEYAREIVRV